MTSLSEAAKYFDSQLKDPARQALLGRQLFAKKTVISEGEFIIDWDSVTEMGDAHIAYELPEEPERDAVALARNTKNIPNLWKGYKVPRDRFEAYRTKGVPLDTVNMRSAMQVVANQEDDLLIQGWTKDGTTYDDKGLYQNAGNDYSTTKGFDTAGYPTDAVAGGMALLEADNIRGVNWNLTLHTTQYHELLAQRSANGVLERPEVLDLLNSGNPGGAPGAIRVSSDITAGTGLLSPVDPAGVYMDLVEAVAMQNHLGMKPHLGKWSPIFGLVIERIYPRILDANCTCKLSVI